MVGTCACGLRAAFIAVASLAVLSCKYFWRADLLTPPQLNREQMYEDYDCLTQTIRDVSPFLTLQEKAYGMDMLEILADRRTGIEDVTNAGQFFTFLSRTLGALKSQHLDAFLGLSPPDTDILDSTLRQELIQKERLDDFMFPGWSLPVRYWNGRYIALFDFLADGQSIPRLSVLETVDGVSVHRMAELYCPQYTAYRDFQNGRFYGSIGYSLPLYLESALPGGHVYGFAAPSGTLSCTLRADSMVSWPTDGYEDQTEDVRYFPGTKTLYIRLRMMDRGLVQQELGPLMRKEAARGQVERIVINIIDNPGGDDRAWRELLSRIVARDFTVREALGVRDNATVRRHVKHTYYASLLQGAATSVPILDGETFLVTSSEIKVAKRVDSIDFSGPIYLVAYNIYSSAGTFLAYSFQNDQIISVGLASGLPLGMGVSPLVITLPNSAIRFRIEPAIDLGRPDTIDGLLGRSVEVPITVSDQDYLDWINYRGDRNDETWVTTLDPFTREAFRTSL